MNPPFKVQRINLDDSSGPSFQTPNSLSRTNSSRIETQPSSSLSSIENGQLEAKLRMFAKNRFDFHRTVQNEITSIKQVSSDVRAKKGMNQKIYSILYGPQQEKVLDDAFALRKVCFKGNKQIQKEIVTPNQEKKESPSLPAIKNRSQVLIQQLIEKQSRIQRSISQTNNSEDKILKEIKNLNLTARELPQNNKQDSPQNKLFNTLNWTQSNKESFPQVEKSKDYSPYSKQQNKSISLGNEKHQIKQCYFNSSQYFSNKKSYTQKSFFPIGNLLSPTLKKNDKKLGEEVFQPFRNDQKPQENQKNENDLLPKKKFYQREDNLMNTLFGIKKSSKTKILIEPICIRHRLILKTEGSEDDDGNPQPPDLKLKEKQNENKQLVMNMKQEFNTQEQKEKLKKIKISFNSDSYLQSQGQQDLSDTLPFKKIKAVFSSKCIIPSLTMISTKRDSDNEILDQDHGTFIGHHNELKSMGLNEQLPNRKSHCQIENNTSEVNKVKDQKKALLKSDIQKNNFDFSKLDPWEIEAKNENSIVFYRKQKMVNEQLKEVEEEDEYQHSFNKNKNK